MSDPRSRTAQPPLPSKVAAVLHELATTAHSFDADEQIYDAVVHAILEVFPAERISALINYPAAPDLPLENAFEWGAPINRSIVHNPTIKPIRISRTSVTQVRHDLNDRSGSPVEQSLFDFGFRQVLINPVLIDHSNVFSLNVFSKQPNAFLDEHCTAIAAIAGMMGLMIAGLKFRREAQFRANEAELLAETLRLMGSTLQTGEVATRALGQIATSLRASALALIYRDGSWTSWVSPNTSGISVDLRWTANRILALPQFSVDPQSASETRPNLDTTLEPLIAAASDEVDLDGMSSQLVQALPFDNDTAWIVMAIRDESMSNNVALPFSADDKRLLELLLRYVAPSWLNAVLHEKLSRALTEREALRRMSTVALSETDPGARIQLVARTAHLLIGADYVTLQIADEASVNVLFVSGSAGTTGKDPTQQSRPDPVAIKEFLLSSGDEPRVLDVSNVVDIAQMPIHCQEQLKSSLTIPFTLELNHRGSLLFGFRRGHQFALPDLRFARLLTETAVASIRADILAPRQAPRN